MTNRKWKLKIFLRSAIMTAVVLLCITAVFLGICESYEQIKRISFTEEMPAVYICRQYIRILDYRFEI